MENVRNELEEDDMETKMKIDIDIIKWKLQPWLRKKYSTSAPSRLLHFTLKMCAHKDQNARQPDSAVPSATEDGQSPAGRNTDPTPVGMEAGTYQTVDRPAVLPDSRPSQYYDPVADAAKGNPGAA